MPHKAVFTDYYYPSLDEERRVFAGTGIEIVDGKGRCVTEQDTIALVRDADAVITQFVPITRRVIDELSRCKVIVRYAIGLDNIDIRAATEHRIMVANVPDYCIAEVSDHAVALILALIRKVKVMDGEVQRGNWSYRRAEPIRRLADLRLGLVGFGNIAREVARKARALGFQAICAYDPYAIRQTGVGVELVPLTTLLESSDIVSIHAPATAETHHLIDGPALARMKPGAFLVNTSRGALVSEPDLCRALQEGRLAGAALDVLEDEVKIQGNPLAGRDNVILTPHMAWYSTGSVAELQRKVAEQVRQAILEGQPSNWTNRF
jgi:D-3-phosphoglycerate dehydrogenase / 2-oxoglutarate reductase